MECRAGCRRRARRAIAAALLGASAWLGACAAPATTSAPEAGGQPVLRDEPVSGSLVFASKAFMDDEADGGSWEQGRNDAALGIGSRPPAFAWRWVVVRQRDRRSTSDGRPRENSSTTTRTLDVGYQRGR